MVAIADYNGNVIAENAFPTQSELGAENLVERIKDCFEKLCESVKTDKQQVIYAGVACPGPLDVKGGRIIHIATMGFRNVPIRQMLADALKMPVFLENDANCAALAESIFGVAKGADPLVYVTISTGVGCGIVVGNQILSGAFSSAGELGHLTVEPDGKECPCGKKGCLELYSSGTAIAAEGTKIKGSPISTKDVFALARSGNQQMQNVIDSAAKKLGLALSAVYHVIDPEAIVLGGSVTKDYDDFANALHKALSEYTQPIENRKFNIKISEFDGKQVLLGALAYAKQQYDS